MSVLVQGPRRDGRHVAVVDGCRLGGAVRPSDDTVGADRGRPPGQRVRREHPRPDDRRLDPGGRDEPLDVGVEHGHRVRLLEEGVRGSVRRREEDDTSRVGRETLDDRRGGRRRGGPDEEDRTDTTQSCVERLGHGEVAGDDLDARRQRRRRLGAMREGADRHARVHQQVDDDAPHPAGRSRDEHRSNSFSCHDVGLSRSPPRA